MCENLVKLKLTKKNTTDLKNRLTLNLIDINNIVASDKIELGKGDKYYIGCKDDEFIRPLCVIFLQISRSIKHFDNSSKKMWFLSENEEFVINYYKTWKIITDNYGYKLDIQPVYDKKYIKIKLKT